MTDNFSIYAGGSVLLLGEYAITKNSSPGISVSILPEVKVSFSKSNVSKIEGRMGKEVFFWTETGSNSSLFDAIVKICGPPAGIIDVDSSGFLSGSRKLGIGSSAAVALTTVAALIISRENSWPVNDYNSVRTGIFSKALLAHRKMQGGRGSGYDLLTSLTGGTVNFVGGKLPSVVSQRSSLPLIFLVEGESSMSTKYALSKYERWAINDVQAANDFRESSRLIVENFLSAEDESEQCIAIKQGGELLEALGEKIGVDVEPPELKKRLDVFRKAGWSAKPVGAGGELGVAVAPKGSMPPPGILGVPIEITEKGLHWQIHNG